MSAAADLLSAGDYALAYPQSVILHHGTRRANDRALTQEQASLVADSLKRSNDRYASRLADRCMERLLFRYVFLQRESNGRRQSPQTPVRELLKRFVTVLRQKVSPDAVQVLDQGFNRYQQALQLSDFVIKAIGPSPAKPPRVAEMEAKLLTSIIKFELKTNRDESWSFQYGGLLQLQEDFALLTSYFLGESNKPLRVYSDRWGYFLLTEDEQKEINAIDEGARGELLLAKTSALFRELWLFLTALCRSLQEGENLMSSEDCFWLGLIDEVIGRTDLPSLRVIMED